MRLPRGVADFFDGGAGDEVTLAANVAAWAAAAAPRAPLAARAPEVATTLLGAPVAAPIGVAPVAYQRLVHPDGELATVRAAGRAGALTIVSTRASVTLEALALASGDGPRWFQVYVLQDRGWTRELVDRAVAAGCRALVLTADTPFLGTRLRDVRNDFSVPEALFMPGRDERADPRASGPGAEQDPSLTPDVIGWLAEAGGVPVVVKGVLRADDAVACVDAGAAAVLVSNHGGRQLDGAVATADALPRVAEAVAGRAEVYVDGGVRTGGDVARALALGARAAFVGRPVAWALAEDGEAGVAALLARLRAELAAALRAAG